MVAALAVFPEEREVELELSMLNILRAITSVQDLGICLDTTPYVVHDPYSITIVSI